METALSCVYYSPATASQQERREQKEVGKPGSLPTARKLFLLKVAMISFMLEIRNEDLHGSCYLTNLGNETKYAHISKFNSDH